MYASTTLVLQLCARAGEADSDRSREAPDRDRDAEGGDGIGLDLPPFHGGMRVQSLPSMSSSDPVAVPPPKSSSFPNPRSLSLELDLSESSPGVSSLESIPEEIPASSADRECTCACTCACTSASRLACRIRSAAEFASSGSGPASLASPVASSDVEAPCSPAREEASTRSGSSSRRPSFRGIQGLQLESALEKVHVITTRAPGPASSSAHDAQAEPRPEAGAGIDRDALAHRSQSSIASRRSVHGQLSRTHLHPHNCNRFDHELLAPTHDWEEEIARRLGTAVRL
eukprot:tig00000254_g22485.t1